MIKIVKLVSGDEFVCDVEIGDKYKLTNPMRAIPTEQGLAFTPPSLVGNEKVILEVDSQHIVYVQELREEVKNFYNEKYGSGISVVSKPNKLII